MNTPTHPASLAHLQATFLSAILPRVLAHARVYFRHLSAERKEEAAAEAVALSWAWHLRLAECGKDAAQFPSAIAKFATRAARSGRRLAGMDRSKDVLSPQARQRHGFLVSTLPEISTLSDNPLAEALHDNMQTPPDVQCAFRVDFRAWRATHNERNQQILHDLMVGERTSDVAGKYGLSPGRVSQLRREFHADWQLFCAEPPQVV